MIVFFLVLCMIPPPIIWLEADRGAEGEEAGVRCRES